MDQYIKAKYLITISIHYQHYTYLLNHFKKYKTYKFHSFDNLYNEINRIEKRDLEKYEKIIIVDDLGIFSSMYFNKIPKIVAASVYDEYSSRMISLHNNAKILCTGYKVVKLELLIKIINLFLEAKFEGGRHLIRINMLNQILK